MLNIFKERLHQGYRTLNYPQDMPALSPRYRGLPVLRPSTCGDCRACQEICITGAITVGENGPILDMGRCLFCGKCAGICQEQKIVFTNEHRMAVFSRKDLIISGENCSLTPPRPELSMFSKSLKIREVSAGGCNACEADTNVLGTLVYDLGRFGIDFVASPRHADGLAVTGPVSTNMRQALLDTWEALPEPRMVIAIGTCAISGGLFREDGDGCQGITDLLPVDVFIPGCPPNPWSILDGFLAATGRVAR